MIFDLLYTILAFLIYLFTFPIPAWIAISGILICIVITVLLLIIAHYQEKKDKEGGRFERRVI